MRRIVSRLVALMVITTAALNAFAQNPSASQQAQAEKAFETGNALMQQRKNAEALTHYKQALAILPKEPAILFNAGLAAYGSKDYGLAVDLWTQLKALDSSDWQVHPSWFHFSANFRRSQSPLRRQRCNSISQQVEGSK